MPDYGRKPLIRLMRRAQLMLWLLSVVFCGLAAGNVGVSEAQSAATPAPAGQRVVTLGADLDAEQQQSILRIFGVKEGESVRQLTVTNAEERALLGDELPADVIGSKAISSALVETTAAGSGIKVERYNITFVTPAMYGNALVTAGVKDARVVVAAPVLLLGLSLSKVGPLPLAAQSGTMLTLEGNSVLYLFLKFFMFGHLLPAPATYGNLSPLLY